MQEESERRAEAEKRNTAQQEFIARYREMLTTTGGKAIRNLQFTVSFTGAIDFAKMPPDIRSQLAQVRTLSFPPGDITALERLDILPELRELDASNQLLTGEFKIAEIKRPLPQLQKLNLSHNSITQISGWQYLGGGIKQLNVSWNRMSGTFAPPVSIEILHCEHNQLTRLDLSKCGNLRSAVCSYNAAGFVIIPVVLKKGEDEPEIVSEQPTYSPEESPAYAPVASPGISSASPASPGRAPAMAAIPAKQSDQSRPANVEELRKQLSVYFEAKSKYEQKNSENKQMIWKKNIENLGKKQTQRLLREYTPSCYSCGNPGGTRFYYDSKKQCYIAKCNAARACVFSMEIYNGSTENLAEEWVEWQGEIQALKQRYISKTQEVEVGLTDVRTAAEESAEMVEEIKEWETAVRNLKQEVAELYSDERREEIAQLKRRIGELVTENEALIRGGPLGAPRAVAANDSGVDMENEEVASSITRAEILVDSEIRHLFPLTQKLREKMFDVNDVFVNGDGELVLRQALVATARSQPVHFYLPDLP
jgi:hypothetical protein